MKRKLRLSIALFMLTLVSLNTPNAFTTTNSIGLPKNSLAPQILTQDINQNTFNLKLALQSGPIILVFYRGGWCPYCNLQLRTLESKLIPQLKNYKAQLVAISVDRVDNATKTRKNEKLTMTLISDPSAQWIKTYNVVNQLSGELVKTYKKNYQIDIEGSSGKKHHIIAIPAVFVIDQNQKIVFSYANKKYKVRAKIDDIINSLKSLSPKK